MLKRLRNKVWSKIEEKLKTELREKQETLEKDCREIVASIELHQKLLQDELREYKTKRDLVVADYEATKLLFESKNNELKQQIKLIEAKASPDSVWIEAFTLGASKNWDTIKSVQSVLNEKAIAGLLKEQEDKLRLEIEDIVSRKIATLGDKRIQNLKKLQDKQKEFEEKILVAEREGNKEDVKKFEIYLKILRWCQDEKISS